MRGTPVATETCCGNDMNFSEHRASSDATRNARLIVRSTPGEEDEERTILKWLDRLKEILWPKSNDQEWRGNSIIAITA